MAPMQMPPRSLPVHRAAFTLIEFSIVLVIIGLIVGGVLVGRDLITASAVRAQISQIERYHQSVNTFRGKTGYLPGDIPDPDATRFGLSVRGTSPAMGDGNGMIEGANSGGQYGGTCMGGGEIAGFWLDLTVMRLLDAKITYVGSNWPSVSVAWSSYITANTNPKLEVWFPKGRFAQNYVYVWSNNGINYFGLSAVYGKGGSIASNPGLSVAQAAAIDKKIDDGIPQSGKVTAQYLSYDIIQYTPVWASGGGVAGTVDTSATAASSTTCYDNANVNGSVQQYSITQNNGAGVNCALSFKFQ